MPQAARGERAQELGQTLGVVALEEAVEVAEAAALRQLRVVAGQGVIQGGAALSREPFADHHFNQATQRTDPLE